MRLSYPEDYKIVNGIDVDNIGHGYIFKRADGDRARCMPNVCPQCVYDEYRKLLINTNTNDKSIKLLIKAAEQFRYYERNHREKLLDSNISREKMIETFDKANANRKMAKEIEEHLNELKTRPKT